MESKPQTEEQLRTQIQCASAMAESLKQTSAILSWRLFGVLRSIENTEQEIVNLERHCNDSMQNEESSSGICEPAIMIQIGKEYLKQLRGSGKELSEALVSNNDTIKTYAQWMNVLQEQLSKQEMERRSEMTLTQEYGLKTISENDIAVFE